MRKLIPYETFIHRLDNDKLLQHPKKALPPISNKDIPLSYSLQSYCPIPYNQGNLGSCTAICGLIKMTSDPLTNASFEPSRLQLYTAELMMEHPGEPLKDVGANAADGCLI